jgi:hypothetical protein
MKNLEYYRLDPAGKCTQHTQFIMKLQSDKLYIILIRKLVIKMRFGGKQGIHR